MKIKRRMKRKEYKCKRANGDERKSDIDSLFFGDLHVTDLILILAIILSVEHGTNGPFHSLRNLIDVLWLDQRLEIILKDFGEVVLKLRATKIRQNLRPIGWIGIAAQVWLLLASQNLQCRRFANTVLSNEPKNFTCNSN